MAFKMSGWSAFTKKDDKPVPKKIKEGTRDVAEKVAKAGSKAYEGVSRAAKKIMKKDNEKGVGRGTKPETKPEVPYREKEVKIVIPKKTISKVEKSEQLKEKEAMDKVIKGK